MKRLVDQHDETGAVSQALAKATQANAITAAAASASASQLEAKKRKYNTIYAMQTISDSSDEGLGSMSPEPTTVTLVSTNSATSVVSTAPKMSNGVTSVNAKERIEVNVLLDMERRKNAALEDRLRQMSHPTTIYTSGEHITYEQHEVIEHTDNLRHADDEQQVHAVHHNLQNMHVLTLDTGRFTIFWIALFIELDIVQRPQYHACTSKISFFSNSPKSRNRIIFSFLPYRRCRQ